MISDIETHWVCRFEWCIGYQLESFFIFLEDELLRLFLTCWVFCHPVDHLSHQCWSGRLQVILRSGDTVSKLLISFAHHFLADTTTFLRVLPVLYLWEALAYMILSKLRVCTAVHTFLQNWILFSLLHISQCRLSWFLDPPSQCRPNDVAIIVSQPCFPTD